MTVTVNPTRTVSSTHTSIDMYTPAQTCSELAVSAVGLLDLVNTGRLAAYNLGGNIRFKVVDVHAAAAQLVSA